MGSDGGHKTELRRTSLVARGDHLDRLREIAEANHRTLSQELRALIAQRIAEMGDEAA